MTDPGRRPAGWHAVDAEGLDLATGRPPAGPGAASPEGALAAAPVCRWPLWARTGDGRLRTVAEALGPGGERVQAFLDALVLPGGAGRGDGGHVDVAALAPETPAGRVDLPVAVVTLAEGVRATELVDPLWLGAVDGCRASLRRALVAAGREAQLEAALHLALLTATERLDPPVASGDDSHVASGADAHVASGARLWLVAGAVVSALAGGEPDPFGPWARLVAPGWWPVGPSGGHLVVCRSEAGDRPVPACSAGRRA